MKALLLVWAIGLTLIFAGLSNAQANGDRTLILGGSHVTGLHKSMKEWMPDEKFYTQRFPSFDACHWAMDDVSRKLLRSKAYDQLIWMPNPVEMLVGQKGTVLPYLNDRFTNCAMKIIWPAVESGKCVTIVQPIAQHSDAYPVGIGNRLFTRSFDHLNAYAWRLDNFVTYMNAQLEAEKLPANLAVQRIDSSSAWFEFNGFSADNFHMSREGIRALAFNITFNSSVCNGVQVYD